MKLRGRSARFVAVWTLALVGVSGLMLAETKKIGMDVARKTALATENGKIKSQELEKEKGRQIYSFDIAMPNGLHEVNIDALTGKVVEDSIENAQDEAKEAGAAKKAKKGVQKPVEKKAPATRNRNERPVVAMNSTNLPWHA
jgi:Peptidase propeptide and YPEB domain